LRVQLVLNFLVKCAVIGRSRTARRALPNCCRITITTAASRIRTGAVAALSCRTTGPRTPATLRKALHTLHHL
jgi:hypothetical protein